MTSTSSATVRPIGEPLGPTFRLPEHPPCPAATPVRRAGITGYADGVLIESEDTVAVEEVLRIALPGLEEIILMRTPGDDEHLIAGHLFSLGLIRSASDVLGILPADGDPDHVAVRLRSVSPRRAPAIPRIGPAVDPERIFELRGRFEARQNLYRTTGSTHAAALFSADGELLAYGEDVSRHCAFDKAVGLSLEERTLGRADIAMLTSRLAKELAAKAAMADIPVLCGFSAATSAGMELARQSGITLIGRIRRDNFRIYANGWRLRP